MVSDIRNPPKKQKLNWNMSYKPLRSCTYLIEVGQLAVHIGLVLIDIKQHREPCSRHIKMTNHEYELLFSCSGLQGSKQRSQTVAAQQVMFTQQVNHDKRRVLTSREARHPLSFKTIWDSICIELSR